MRDFKEWERTATDEQLEEMLLGGAQPGSPAYAAAEYILNKRRRDREAAIPKAPLPSPARPRLVVDFSFLKASALREIAERDWEECQCAFDAKCWKSVLILAGGIVETVLLAILRRRKSRALKTKAASGGGSDLTRWTLDRIIKVAAELKLVPPAVETLPNPLRQYRNLAHPGNEVREKLEFGEPDAATAFNAVRSILIRLSRDTYTEAHANAATAESGLTRAPMEKREVQDKSVTTEYVEKSGLVAKLKDQGYDLKWDSANNEAMAVDIDRWEVVIEEQSDRRRVRFKIHDHPVVGGYMILLKRKRGR